MAEQADKVLRMARPASYWARRAALHQRRGNRHQAEALLRHAVALTPDSIPLKLAYARALQEMRHYEASNYQAFAVLAQDPECNPCIGLIGQNLMALGYPEEAADAYAHALRTDSESMAEVHGEQLDRLEALLNEPAACGARYRTLVQLAAERLSAGEWEQAGGLLARACAMPRRDERCHALRSLCFGAIGNTGRAIREAHTACRIAPRSARAYMALAELQGAAGRRGQALKTLLLAANRVLTAQDERQLCQTAMTLNLPLAPLPALERAGGRVQTLFNKAVLLLKAGRTQPALRALDQCRALDPGDVSARYLRLTAQAIAALPRGRAEEYTQGLRLYPALPDADSEACYRALSEAFGEGADAFARRLQADESLYRLLLYQAENPRADISGMLEQVIGYLSEKFMERLMRGILLLPMGGIAEKQLAIQLLTQGKPKPFVLWHGGRLSFIRPHGSGGSDEELRLREHLLAGAREGYSPQLLTHALRLLHRMSGRARQRIAYAEGDAFFAAVRMHCAKQGAKTAPQAVSRRRHVRRLYRMLLSAAPIARISPRLWISGRREETE